jgi:hypothetical protein
MKPAKSYSWFALDAIAAMLEEREQKNPVNNYYIWILFSSNVPAKSLPCKSEGIVNLE